MPIICIEKAKWTIKKVLGGQGAKILKEIEDHLGTLTTQ